MSQKSELLKFIKLLGVIHVRDLDEQEVRRSTLSQLVKEKRLIRIARGLYCSVDYVPTRHSVLVPVALSVPDVTFSLLTSLWFHGLLIQPPPDIWITIPTGTRVPKRNAFRLQVARTTRETYLLGRERHVIDDVPLHCYSVERSIVDCFKYRNRIGLEIAIDILRLGVQQKSVNVPLIKQIAKRLRLLELIQPYLTVLQSRKLSKSATLLLEPTENDSSQRDEHKTVA